MFVTGMGPATHCAEPIERGDPDSRREIAVASAPDADTVDTGIHLAGDSHQLSRCRFRHWRPTDLTRHNDLAQRVAGDKPRHRSLNPLLFRRPRHPDIHTDPGLFGNHIVCSSRSCQGGSDRRALGRIPPGGDLKYLVGSLH